MKTLASHINEELINEAYSGFNLQGFINNMLSDAYSGSKVSVGKHYKIEFKDDDQAKRALETMRAHLKIKAYQEKSTIIWFPDFVKISDKWARDNDVYLKKLQ